MSGQGQIPTRGRADEARTVETDVAVVGAGPVGLLTALLLGRRGVSVAIVERWPNFYPLPRACTIDHEAIRILQSAGLAEEFEPLIDPVIGAERPYKFLDQHGETLLQIDWNRPGASGWAQANGIFPARAGEDAGPAARSTTERTDYARS